MNCPTKTAFCVSSLDVRSSQVRRYDLLEFALRLTDVLARVTGNFVKSWKTDTEPQSISHMQPFIEDSEEQFIAPPHIHLLDAAFYGKQLRLGARTSLPQQQQQSQHGAAK